MQRQLNRRSMLTWLLVISASGANLVSAASGETSGPASHLDGKVLGRFKDRLGFQRIYVLLTPGLPEAQFIEIASAWHVREPEGWLWFLDDDKKADEMLNALPEVQRGNTMNYPAEWVAAHSLGHVQMELVPGGGKRWTLMQGPERTGTPLAILDR